MFKCGGNGPLTIYFSRLYMNRELPRWNTFSRTFDRVKLNHVEHDHVEYESDSKTFFSSSVKSPQRAERLIINELKRLSKGAKVETVPKYKETNS